MFHDVRRHTAQAEEDMRRTRPDLAPMLDALRVRYMKVHYNSRFPTMIHARIDADIHAVLCLLLSPDYEAAREKIIAERQLSPNTESLFLKALNDAGPVLAPVNDELADRGLLLARGRYFRARENLRKGTPFDKLCKMVKPELKDVLDDAIYRALANGTKPVSAAQPFTCGTLPYIALRLAAHGSTLKDFIENEITFGVKPKTVEDNLHRTKAAIRILENAHGVAISDPADAGPDWSAYTELAAPPRAGVPIYGPALPSGTVNVIPLNDNPAPRTGGGRQREEEIIAAMKDGDLTAAHAKIYVAMERVVRMAPGSVPRKEALRALREEYKLPVSGLREHHAAMASALQAYRQGAKAAEPSDIDFHQPRAVRP